MTAKNNGNASSMNQKALADMFKKNREALCNVIGMAQSIKVLADGLPTTAIEDDAVVCPELVFPLLATGVIERANEAWLQLEKLEAALRDSTH